VPSGYLQSHDRQGLFEQICRIIVDFGHAKLAWVGELIPDSKQVKVAAAFGSGLDYLVKAPISADPDSLAGSLTFKPMSSRRCGMLLPRRCSLRLHLS